MFILSSFNFSNYPDILNKYKKYTSLSNKFYKACDKNANNIDDLEKKMNEYMCSEVAKSVYDAFIKEKPNLIVQFGEEKGLEKEWNVVFPTEFNLLNNDQKSNLWGLIDGHYNYLLPKKYYLENTSFQFL